MYDGSACDGEAVSCEEHRKTSWKKEKEEKKRECDSCDNIHSRDKILKSVTTEKKGVG